jgi:hypothetical protein
MAASSGLAGFEEEHPSPSTAAKIIHGFVIRRFEANGRPGKAQAPRVGVVSFSPHASKNRAPVVVVGTEARRWGRRAARVERT